MTEKENYWSNRAQLANAYVSLVDGPVSQNDLKEKALEYYSLYSGENRDTFIAMNGIEAYVVKLELCADMMETALVRDKLEKPQDRRASDV